MDIRSRLVGTKAGIILLIGIALLVTGCTDIDWMITSYYYDMWQSTQEDWHFTPFFQMNWWLAYIFTLLRIIIGSAIIGAYLYGQKV